jgi:hypothetical protein
VRALKEAVTALEEQVNARVNSVENGRKYLAEGGKTVDMPDGASIFETTGAWEDFATPSRDLRLLIAIDVVRGFPVRVARRPERYAMLKGKSAAEVKAELGSHAGLGACCAQILLYAHRRLAMDSDAQGRARSRVRFGDGL